MKFQPINSESGNILSAGYDSEEKRLVVNFQGGKSYEYSGVPQNAWNAFSSTFDDKNKSTGSHFHKFIRSYPCKRL